MQTTTTSRNHRDIATAEAAPWLRLLPEDGWLTLTLLAVLVYTTIASIQGVGWGVAGLEILTWTTGVGLLLGYAAVQQGRLPGTLVHLVALALGVAFAYKETADAAIGGDRGALWDHVRIWFHQAIVDHGVSNDNIVFLLFLAILSFLLAYISVWLVIHTRRPWLAALANGVVLLINLNGATDDRALFFLVIYLLATLLLLVRFTLAENMRHWRARGLRFSPDLGWDFMQAGAIFAVTVLLLAYLLPSGSGSASLLNYWNSTNNPWQALQNTWSNLFAGANGNGSGFGDLGFFGSGMTLKGTVKLSSNTILRYTLPRATDDPLQYLMTETFDTYNGTNMFTSQLTQATEYGPSDNEPTSPGVQPNTLKTDTYDIVFQSVQGTDLFAPGSEPASFSVAADAYLNVTSNVPVHWNAQTQIVSGTHYISVGYVSTATADQLRQVAYPQNASSANSAAFYPQEVLSEYLPANETISPEVVQAALDATKGTTNMYDAAVHIQDYLRTFKYSTTNPNPPAGQDAIAWFLSYKQGFCTFFAAAMAMMGRAMGMPTRVVEGFTKGTYDARNGQWVVTGQDAHAWTQVYFAKYGWINFEPTSSFDAFARAVPGVGTGSATPTGGTGATGTPTPNTHGRQPGDVAPPDTGQTSPAGRALIDIGLSLSLLIALLLMFAALFATWWRLLYRGLSPVTAAFARILRLGGWAGAPPRRSQTPDEYAEQLAGVIPGQRNTLHRLSQLYATERWGGGLERERVAEVPRLYEQVRSSTAAVIARRARHLPLALLRAARNLRRRRRLRTRTLLDLDG